jgi:predicted flavoprotein YhiN
MNIVTVELQGNPLFNKKIIIVGAGISGLTAAYELEKDGYTVCIHMFAGISKLIYHVDVRVNIQIITRT